ncbi:hypothetical protein PR048_022362 [Dryococelus australis]|uniref:Uncharacterized protein n=1 Tax=Dryococelus australis TaxID=614101 RepID=A0ABQ9H0T2_9NEOP|nr:hypothetical protein PR048_022362 [Dryococelus australis]
MPQTQWQPPEQKTRGNKVAEMASTNLTPPTITTMRTEAGPCATHQPTGVGNALAPAVGIPVHVNRHYCMAFINTAVSHTFYARILQKLATSSQCSESYNWLPDSIREK